MEFDYLDDTKQYECPICLCPWVDPVEFSPCGHIFCKSCTLTLTNCPECRQAIASRKSPNRLISNLLDNLKVRCKKCNWTGAREQVYHHQCRPGSYGTPQQGSLPAPIGVPQFPQQQGFQPGPPQPIGVKFPAFPQQPQPPPQQPLYKSAPNPHGQILNEWDKYNLTQYEYDTLCALFLQFDVNDCGQLRKSELTTLATWLNFPHTRNDIDEMFRQMDTDRSGSLSLDEFCGWMKDKRPDPRMLYGLDPETYRHVLMQFHTFDTDQNGQINEREFTQLCRHMGPPYPTDPAGIQALFRAADTNRSGSIDLHELLTARNRMQLGR